MSEAIGIMNDAYFVGRHELIDWVNSLLKLNIAKVEECCTGAIHCQIFDALYPGKMNMAKVNYEAKHEYEYVKNFKLLQDLFTKVDIQHYVPVDRVIKGKYQDNLELLQWVYEVFNRNSNGAEYDAVKRRSKSRGGATAHCSTSTKRPGAAPRKAPSRTDTAPKRRELVEKPSLTKPPTGKEGAIEKAAEELAEKAADELAKSRKEVTTLTAVLKELEKERDWYFSKIIEVEKICKAAPFELQQSSMLEEIFTILYAADNDPDVAGEDELF